MSPDVGGLVLKKTKNTPGNKGLPLMICLFVLYTKIAAKSDLSAPFLRYLAMKSALQTKCTIIIDIMHQTQEKKQYLYWNANKF